MTTIFVISVRLFVRMKKIPSHWTDFREILYLIIFRKSIQKIQASLKYDRNNGHFKRRPIYICDYNSLNSSKNEKSFRQNFAKIKAQILCSVIFFFINRTVYEIMWNNTIRPDRPHMKIYGACALHAGYIRLQTHTQNIEYSLFYHWKVNLLQERLSMFRSNVHRLSGLLSPRVKYQ